MAIRVFDPTSVQFLSTRAILRLLLLLELREQDLIGADIHNFIYRLKESDPKI